MRGGKREGAGRKAGSIGESTPKKSNLRPPFQPGVSANPAGRPKGSRNKLGEAFVQALQADFEAHGADSIKLVRVERPHEYLKVIASILPKEIKVSTDIDGLTDEQLDQRIRQIAAALDLTIRSEAGTSEPAGAEEAPARYN